MSEATTSSIVYRIAGQKSVVEAAAIKDTEDLAYAIGFLMNHRLYKMSKAAGSVSLKDAETVAMSLLEANTRFNEEVIEPLGGNLDISGYISGLGRGEVVNPYSFVDGLDK